MGTCLTENPYTPTKPPRILGLALLTGALLAAAAALWTAAALRPTPALLAAASLLSAAILAAAAWYVRKVLVWGAGRWIGPYLLARRYRLRSDLPLDVCFQFIDHFEPDYGRADPDRQLRRVRRWEEAYAAAIEGCSDSDGRCPQHTWFFAVSENAPEAARLLARWPGRRWGEIEYHMHHDPQTTAPQLRQRIRRDIQLLRELGAVSSGRYGFVHGMFALAAGDRRWCNIVGELDVLVETGCYADFTFGSIGTPAQPRQVNSIYYARTTGRPKPHNSGAECVAGRNGTGLLIFPGPMCFGLFGRVLDDADLGPRARPHPRRIGRWLDAHVHVRGRPNWVFINVHAHSAPEDDQDALFTGAMQALWAALEARFRLHYLTAREAYNVVKAAEAGCDGDPNDYRDFEIPPPANRGGGRNRRGRRARGV